MHLPAGSANVEAMTVTPKPGWKRPPMEPFRRYSPKVEAVIRMDLHIQLDAGIIEESDLDNGCYVHAVPKPDSESGYRFCVDFRIVNNGVETDPYPLPPIFTILLSLAAVIFFARLDLKSGYWQFPVEKGCKEWLAIYALGKCTRTAWCQWVLCSPLFTCSDRCASFLLTILAKAYLYILAILLFMVQHGMTLCKRCELLWLS